MAAPRCDIDVVMELFFSADIALGGRTLDREESNHCIKVLRHREGDEIHIIDGHGNLFRCTITDPDPKGTAFEVEETVEGYGSHPYRLTMAVAPPKNIDRFEWFCEKATEIGVDVIVPLQGEYSERKVFKGERCGRILVSAAKQSHKGAIPLLEPLERVGDFLRRDFAGALKCICYCGGDDSKRPLVEVLREAVETDYVVMIGPEGDFSREEIALAHECGWQVASIGESRLRIETAALTAVAAAYLLHSGD